MALKKLSKSQIVAALADKTGLAKKDVLGLLTELHELAVKEVKKNGAFNVADLGKLVKVHRKARMGRNPATGESIKIAAKTVVKFRVSKPVKDSLL
jgi:DNA-binding protein HU-beta